MRTGLIDRFGSIDPNEGGITQRENLNVEYRWKINDTQRLNAQAYLTYYSADRSSTTSRSSSTIPSTAT